LRTVPRLYAIIDPTLLDDGSVSGVSKFARELIVGGATLIQLRDKREEPIEILSEAREMWRIARASSEWGVRLIMNDRADLCLAADFDGVHVGQDDLSPDGARRVVGKQRWVGISTHNPEQVRVADQSDADYIAIGPIFQTQSKQSPDPVVGLEGIRAARDLTKKPLVAIGGLDLENCRSAIDAGADAIAVISSLLEHPRKRTEEFLRKLE
jgi:thiamine-phosphate pyrophosphorylase